MRNLKKFDDFFAFLTEAGDAVAVLCTDPWFVSRGGDMSSFAGFICRCKECMVRIAAAGDGIGEDKCRDQANLQSLSDRVTDILNEGSVRDFFGLSAFTGRFSADSALLTGFCSAECAVSAAAGLVLRDFCA